MELDKLFHFNIEVHLSSSTVIGSLSYYPSWMFITMCNLIKCISAVVTLEQPLRQARISKVLQEVEK